MSAPSPPQSDVQLSASKWPSPARFAFTIFDDPDALSLQASERVYGFLAEQGFLTTKGIWPAGPVRQRNSSGDTCSDAAYLKHVIHLHRTGFEIGFHHAAPHSSLRSETDEALRKFADWFGVYPSAMANHYNQEALYWGKDRVSGIARMIYSAAQLANPRKTRANFEGHIESSPYFWGDLARERIRYCRNFVYNEINTLKMCPGMPYHDPTRPFVPYWYASTDGNNCAAFVNALSEANQDRLESEGGGCIMYVHFGHGFVEGKQLNPRFVASMKRLSRKPGWFVPVTTMLDYLRSRGTGSAISPSLRSQLEIRWLVQKFRKGTS